MLLARDGAVEKLDTRTARNRSPAAYTAWHPSGRVMAFSVNRPELWHRTAGLSRAVIDRDSNVAVYDVAADQIRSTTQLVDPDYLLALKMQQDDHEEQQKEQARLEQEQAQIE